MSYGRERALPKSTNYVRITTVAYAQLLHVRDIVWGFVWGFVWARVREAMGRKNVCALVRGAVMVLGGDAQGWINVIIINLVVGEGSRGVRWWGVSVFC